jgi:UDP-N-acetylglucosamine 2-epimerase (non-hydrolysing)
VKKRRIMTVFGTRPEAIKLAPIIHELERRRHAFETVNVNSGQHRDLLRPFIARFALRVDHDLQTYCENQEPHDVSRAVTRHLKPILERELPDLLLVQGDTSTALGAAEAGWNAQVPVAHIEAGLRSGDEAHPFPEEIHRKRIARVASYHFAPTMNNRRNLLSEGVSDSRVFVTGNTVVDSLQRVLNANDISDRVHHIVKKTIGTKRILVTMHRRENLHQLQEVFLALRRFVDMNSDISLVFPVHPNPAVRGASAVLQDHPRIHLLEPLDYPEFIALLRCAWIVVTDSGGIQEEAPTLGKTVLLFRAKTERPEALATGIHIVRDTPDALISAIEQLKSRMSPDEPSAWTNPFGTGQSAKTIVDILEKLRMEDHEPAVTNAF